jgi:hypothetical protein
MNQYTNPDLTQREIVEASLLQIDTLIDAIDTLAADTKADRDADAIDHKTSQAIDMQLTNFDGCKINLTGERDRLTAIIATWDAAA